MTIFSHKQIVTVKWAHSYAKRSNSGQFNDSTSINFLKTLKCKISIPTRRFDVAQIIGQNLPFLTISINTYSTSRLHRV